MDKWKSFFQSSGSDIWTVIDRAITIAAVEQPAELRSRRDKFTEKMFCPTEHLSGLCDCDDGEEEEEENGGGAMSRSDGGDGEDEDEEEEEEEEDDAGETKLVVSGGGALREDEEDFEEEEDEVEVVDDQEEDQDDNVDQEQSRNRRKSSKADCSFMDVEALSDEMEKESKRIKEIIRIKNQISNYADEEDYLCESLERLESMHISFEALKATEIGRPVNNLRKHPSLRVRAIVKRLISGWKTLAEEWTKSAEHFTGATSTTGHFDNNYGLPSPPVDEGELLAAGTAPLEVNKLFDFIEDDMSAGSGDMNEKPRRGSSGDWVRGIYEDAHSPEETKPAAATRKTGESEADRKNKQQASVSRKDSSKNSDSKRSAERESSRGKMSTSQQQNGSRGSQAAAVAATANGKHSSGSGSVGAKQQRPDDQRHKAATSNTSRLMKPGVASVSRPKSSSASLPSSASKRSVEERIQSYKSSSSSKTGSVPPDLAAAKRKLHEGYKQAENAKKQRTVQVMELTDLPKGKGGPKAAKASASSKLHHAQHNNRYNSIHGRR